MTKPIIATIDFEASSLNIQGTVIEVGIAIWERGGPIQTWSSLVYMDDDVWWSEESAKVHGIRREALVQAPRKAIVAERLETHMANSPVAFCDGGEDDERWMKQLYRGTGGHPCFCLAPIEAMPGLHLDKIARRMWEFLETTKTVHRAGDDALRLMLAYAHALGEVPDLMRFE